jgi:hypothetical protein
MWPLILTFGMQVIPVIPSLVTDVENLFRGKAKQGPAKWLAVEQLLAPTVEELTGKLIAVAPAGTKALDIEKHVKAYTKAVNDATVAFANAVGAFPGSTGTAVPAQPPKG